MKKQICMIVLGLLALTFSIPMETFAKKIRFGNYVVYSGKVH